MAGPAGRRRLVRDCPDGSSQSGTAGPRRGRRRLPTRPGRSGCSRNAGRWKIRCLPASSISSAGGEHRVARVPCADLTGRLRQESDERQELPRSPVATTARTTPAGTCGSRRASSRGHGEPVLLAAQRDQGQRRLPRRLRVRHPHERIELGPVGTGDETGDERATDRRRQPWRRRGLPRIGSRSPWAAAARTTGPSRSSPCSGTHRAPDPEGAPRSRHCSTVAAGDLADAENWAHTPAPTRTPEHPAARPHGRTAGCSEVSATPERAPPALMHASRPD